MGYLEEILDALQDEGRFIRLTLSGPRRADAEWRKVVILPVQLSARRALQAALQGTRKQVTRNFTAHEARRHLEEFLRLGFRHVELQCADGDLHVRISKKGKALVSRGKPSAPAPAAPAPHDRAKQYPFPADEPDEFLEKMGVMRHGRVRASMRDKFRQVNQFLILLRHTRLAGEPRPGTIRLLDCGCGRAFLTFAAYHYLRKKLGLDVGLAGVDADEEVLAAARKLRDQLGCGEVGLIRSRILEYEPPEKPDAVLSLHACDTATDEAIAQGVKWNAGLILCVPCCQHELHHQLSREDFRAALRHGILRERIADILTDALRAAALRVMGYRTDVIEFISPGHTAKNLMIRAEKARGMRTREAAGEYLALRDAWGVTPAIETLLGEEFAKRLAGPRSRKGVQ